MKDEPSVSSPEEDYERDFSGRVVYRPRGYYYDAVRASDAGERVKVDVGVVDDRRARTFCIAKRLTGESDLVEVTMERPLGSSSSATRRGASASRTSWTAARLAARPRWIVCRG